MVVLTLECLGSTKFGPLKRFFAVKGRKASCSHPKMRGIKKQHGEEVHSGDVLVTQYGRLKFYPGVNVGCQKDRTLVALADGKVIVTHEKLFPKSDSPLYKITQRGCEIIKPFFNIYTNQNLSALGGSFELKIVV